MSSIRGRIPAATSIKKQHQQTIDAIKKFADLEIISFPNELDTDAVYKHDAVFVRDSFISNQQKTVVISNYAARERQVETEHFINYFKKNGYTIHTLSSNAHAEGGEFYYIKTGNILFAGISRNNKKGVLETAKYLNISDICIVASDAFHLDTVLTIILDKNGKLTGVIACLKLIKNPDDLKNFTIKHTVPLLDINPYDAIGFDGKGNIAVNCLPLPGILIGGGKFETLGIEKTLKQLEIKHIVSPVTQFYVSGGGIHCLTNELSY